VSRRGAGRAMGVAEADNGEHMALKSGEWWEASSGIEKNMTFYHFSLKLRFVYPVKSMQVFKYLKYVLQEYTKIRTHNTSICIHMIEEILHHKPDFDFHNTVDDYIKPTKPTAIYHNPTPDNRARQTI
jgi:hypothetical protein